ncbi:serine acetyltransferase [Striga asiatica]|uniref:serine O-acetyltransferase n=1 Tax=Striga asiatica TaxID=4170 RepID=A0A5A7R4H3_STRAF|nr:serine acetyltransferase [Striga asiatica]
MAYRVGFRPFKYLPSVLAMNNFFLLISKTIVLANQVQDQQKIGRKTSEYISSFSLQIQKSTQNQDIVWSGESWFCSNQDSEVEPLVPSLNPHSREVFITPCRLEISARHVDGPAEVLTPKHFLQHSSARSLVSYREFVNNRVRPFALNELSGYADQRAVSSLEEMGTREPVGENVEILCQDKGVKGCWFRCKVLSMMPKCLRVVHCDVSNVDGSGQLEDWVAKGRVAYPDELGMRSNGRLTVGAAVDVWWFSGWWEAVVTGIDTSEQPKIQVYLPGEHKFLFFERKDVRVSKDWVGEQWVDVKPKLNILSFLNSHLNTLPKVKLPQVSKSELSSSSASNWKKKLRLERDANAMLALDTMKASKQSHIIARITNLCNLINQYTFCTKLNNSCKSTTQELNQDPIWLELRQEAELNATQEPFLSEFFDSSILSHASLESALANTLSIKLSDMNLSKQDLYNVFHKTLVENTGIQAAVRDDLKAVRERDPACLGYLNCFLNFKGFLACQAHRLAHEFWAQSRIALAHVVQSRVSEVFAVDIHPGAEIGRGMVFDHATGVVIGRTAVVGDGATIMHGVTLGEGDGGSWHPVIGDGVVIGAGAKVLGGIRVGQSAKVGAGAVVGEEVPPGKTAVGNPARLVGLR